MANTTQGYTPTQVDSAALYPVGIEIDDPRGGQFAGNKIKYVRANGSIAANDAVRCDPTYTTASERHATVVSTSAISQAVEGANDVATGGASAGAITSGQFFWITVKGRAAVKTSGVAVGANQKLGTSGTSGTLTGITATTPTSAEVIAAIAAAVGKGVVALSDTNTPSTGLSYVILS